jgi:hypothetical protein
MHTQERTPRWGWIYLMFLIIMGLLWLESHAALTVLGHQAAQIGLVLVFFALVHAWLRAERVALMRQSLDDAARHDFTYQLVPPEEPIPVDWPRREEIHPKSLVVASQDEERNP